MFLKTITSSGSTTLDDSSLDLYNQCCDKFPARGPERVEIGNRHCNLVSAAPAGLPNPGCIDAETQ